MRFTLLLLLFTFTFALVSAQRCHRDKDLEERFLHEADKVEERRSPSQTIEEMCIGGKNERRSDHYFIEFSNYNKEDCFEAVKYAAEHERLESNGEWLVTREFQCGAMTVLITGKQ